MLRAAVVLSWLAPSGHQQAVERNWRLAAHNHCLLRRGTHYPVGEKHSFLDHCRDLRHSQTCSLYGDRSCLGLSPGPGRHGGCVTADAHDPSCDPFHGLHSLLGIRLDLDPCRVLSREAQGHVQTRVLQVGVWSQVQDQEGGEFRARPKRIRCPLCHLARVVLGGDRVPSPSLDCRTSQAIVDRYDRPRC